MVLCMVTRMVSAAPAARLGGVPLSEIRISVMAGTWLQAEQQVLVPIVASLLCSALCRVVAAIAVLHPNGVRGFPPVWQ